MKSVLAHMMDFGQDLWEMAFESVTWEMADGTADQCRVERSRNSSGLDDWCP